MADNITFNLDEKIITIDFNSIFGRNDLNHMSNFIINRRSYYNIMEMITNDIGMIINKENNYVQSLLNIKYCMNTFDNYTLENIYLNVLHDIIQNKALKKDISDIIEGEYNLTLDIDVTHTKKKVNKELQVTDSMNKKFLKSCFMMRLCIPIICMLPDNKKTNNFTYNLFERVIREFWEGNNEGLNKLYRTIFSRIIETKYGDIKMWNYLSNRGEDCYVIIKKYYNIIIRNIMPKVLHVANIVTYLHVVVKYKLNYLFIYNYPISYRPLISKPENDDELSEREKLEINLIRKDECPLIINKLSIVQEVKRIKEEFEITDEYIEEYKKIRQLNSIQMYLMEIYYSKKFRLNSSVNDLYVLLMGQIYELQDLSFKILPNILDSNLDDKVRRANNKRKLAEKVTSNKKYSKLLRYYVPVSNILENNNFLLSLMSVKNNKFIDDDGKEVSMPSELLAEELLDFLLLV